MGNTVTKLAAICPLDGRYKRKTENLAELLGREQLCSVDEEQSLDTKTREAILRLSPVAYIGDAVQLTEKYTEEIRAYLKQIS